MGMNRLPSNVVSALRTDVTITSAPQCITELVLNSIDAKATSIAVRVDLNLFKLQVIDNGSGISKHDLSLLGNRYMTSKCHSLNDLRSNLSSFGFRGEALASLCEVAGTVMITSRPSGSDNTYCKIITQGRHQKVVHSSRPRSAQGTTILVGDFLYNRPVRRARVKAAFDLEEIKTHLEYIALIHPQVSFSLRDDSSGQMIVETRKSNNVVDTFSSLFGPAIAETLCPVMESSKPFEVSGYISKEAYAHKNLQFIYINKRLVLKSKLHKLVNSIMGRSSILKMNNVPHNTISKELSTAFFLAMSPPKRAKHAVYILNVTCPYSEYDITLDPKKTLVEFKDWDIILNCFEKLLRNFLEPQLTPDSPVRESSVLDEIDRLAREDALAKGGGLPTNLGPRTILGLPARRDTIIYTPPSQYTQESTVISSDDEKRSMAPLTSHSEDPFPAHLRDKAPTSASSENPFPTILASNRNNSFSTTSQEDSSSVSTKEFLTMFKQPVFHKKLKHPKPQMKLPVGNSLHFDLNLQRITYLFPPAGFVNDVAVDGDAAKLRNRSIFNSLQKFSNEKSAQMSAASNDTAKYHTPLNAQKPSQTHDNQLVDSIPDLPFVSDLEARPGTPSTCATPPGTVVQTSLPVHEIASSGETGTTLEENDETILENDFVSEITYNLPKVPHKSEPHSDSALQSSETDSPDGDVHNQLQSSSSDEVIQINKHDNIGKNTSEPEMQVGEVLSIAKVFMSSEDFLISQEDVIGSSEADDIQCTTSSTASLLANTGLFLKDSNAQDENLSAYIIDELLKTDPDEISYGRRTQNCDSMNELLPVLPRQCPIGHKENSQELFCFNAKQSSSNSQSEPLDSESKGSETSKIDQILNLHQMRHSSVSSYSIDPCISGLHSEQTCESDLKISSDASSASNFLGKSNESSPVKDNSTINPRKRNVEKKNTDDPDEPLKKIISLEKSDSKNPEITFTAHVDIHFNTARGISDSSKSSPEKGQCTGMEFDNSPESHSSSGRLKRHSVLLNCSMDGLLAVLSPRQNLLLKEEKMELLDENNEFLKSNKVIEVSMKVETSEVLEQVSNETKKFSEGVTAEPQTGTGDKSTRISQHTDEFQIPCDESFVAVHEKAKLEMSGCREATPAETQSSSEIIHDQGDTNLIEDNSDEPDNWEEHTDSSNRKYFVHSKSGTIRFEQPSEEIFTMEERCRFLPKGLSPMVGNHLVPPSKVTHHLTDKSDLSSLLDQAGLAIAKWPNGKPEGAVDDPWPLVDQVLSTFEPAEEVPVASAIIQDQPHCQIKVYNVCYPYTFNKDIFSNLRVLGQLDHKFIVTIAKVPFSTEFSEVVILFDQHAVHERIRVEQLTEEYREPGTGIVWRSSPVHPALPLSLNAREVRVMTNCTDKLRALGLRFSKHDSHSVRITAVPTCLLLREDREVHGRGASVLKSHLESLIREEVDALVQTRGAGVEQPAIIRNVIASEACRGAVKFGHPLETEDCRAFLHNLSKCKLPFQCAHGRPALMPIADLSYLPRPAKPRRPNLWKLRRT